MVAVGCRQRETQQGGYFFLDGDDRLGMLQPAHQSPILPFGLRQFGRQRIAYRRLWPSFDRRQSTERASLAQPAPFAQGRRVQTFPAQDGAGAASGSASDLGQNPQLVPDGERQIG